MRTLTGIQASGKLHIGNYFGAIKQIIEAQNNKKEGDEIFLMVADLHALTSVRDAKQLRENVKNTILDYLACGLDPEKIVLYVQSDIPEVCELQWYLSSVTPMGMLNQGHSYKDKVAKGIAANLGLYTYPVLMAADILIVNSDLVPVGKDQIQHVEMTRDIATKFNNTYGEIFTIPEHKVIEELKTIPGIDGQKMSKSYGNTIPLFPETENELKKKIMSIETGSEALEDKLNPENCTVFTLYELIATKEEIEELRKNYLAGGFGYGNAKKELLRKTKEYFGPFWEKRKELEKDKNLIEEVRKIGEGKMRYHARKILEKTRRKTGIR